MENSNLNQEKIFSVSTALINSQKFGRWKLDLNSLTFLFDDSIVDMLMRIGWKTITETISLLSFSETFIHQDDISFIKERYQEALLNKDNINYTDRFEFRILGSDQTEYIIHANAKISTAGFIEGKAQNITYRYKESSDFINQEIGFRSVINNTTDYLFTVSPEGKFILWNNNYEFAARKYFNKEIYVGMFAAEVLPEEKREEWLALLKLALNGEEVKAELSLDLDKKYFYEVCANPIKGINDTINGVACWVNDVTEKKLIIDIDRLESKVLGFALQNSSLEETLYLLLSGVEELVPSLKTFVNVTDKNDKELIWKCNPRIPPSYIDLVPVISIGIHSGCAGAAAYTRKPVFVKDISSSESWKTFRDISLLSGFRACTAYPIVNPDGNILGTLGAFIEESRDFTAIETEFIERSVKLAGILLDREAALNSFAQKQFQLEKLSSFIPGFIYEIRGNAKGEREFVYVSEKSQEIIGIKASELLKDYSLIWSCIFHEDIVRLSATLQASIVNQQPWNEECRIIKPGSKEIRWFKINAEQIKNTDGSFSSFGILFDIHDLKITEHNCGAKEEELSAIITSFEHSLKTIKVGIKNNFRLISSLLKLQQLYSDSNNIQFSARESRMRLKCVEIVNDNLSDGPETPSIQFDKCIQQICNYIQTEFSENIQIKSEIEKHIINPSLAISCALILSELLSNNFNHAFKNREDAVININFSKSGGYFILEVKDNGCGLPKDINFHEPETMGLNLIKTIVKEIKGNIEIKTGINKGLSVTITFPEESIS